MLHLLYTVGIIMPTSGRDFFLHVYIYVQVVFVYIECKPWTAGVCVFSNPVELHIQLWHLPVEEYTAYINIRHSVFR